MSRNSWYAMGFACLLCAHALSAEAASERPTGVLIIHAGGQPAEKYRSSELTREDLDAITMATPKAYNTHTIAADLGRELESRGITVKVVDASEINSHEIVFEYSVLVLGAPARYGEVGWEMKKFVDEMIWRIHCLVPDRFANHRVAAYAMGASSEGGTTAVLNFLDGIMTANRTTLGARADFLRHYSSATVANMIKLFADEIVELLPSPPAEVSNYKAYDDK